MNFKKASLSACISSSSTLSVTHLDIILSPIPLLSYLRSPVFLMLNPEPFSAFPGFPLGPYDTVSLSFLWLLWASLSSLALPTLWTAASRDSSLLPFLRVEVFELSSVYVLSSIYSLPLWGLPLTLAVTSSLSPLLSSVALQHSSLKRLWVLFCLSVAVWSYRCYRSPPLIF